MRPQPPTPIRPSEEIAKLKQRCADLERRMADVETDRRTVEQWQEVANSLQETVDQLLGVIQSGKAAAPIFLRWDYTQEHEGSRQEARARFGRYTLEVIDNPSAVYSLIKHGSRIVWAGGHPCSFSAALDEAEEALRRLIQERQIKEVKITHGDHQGERSFPADQGTL